MNLLGCEESYPGAWTPEGSGKVLVLQRVGQGEIGDRQVYHKAGSSGERPSLSGQNNEFAGAVLVSS